MSWLGIATRQGLGRIWTCRWTFGVPIATLAAAASIFANRLPDTYEAVAVVRVRELSSGTGGGGLPEERASAARATVETTYDRLFAPANLRAAAPHIAPGANPDDLRTADAVRAAMAFERQGEYSFTVRAVGPDPERSSKAVNAMLQSFLENERRDPLKRAESTRDFRDQEVQDAKAEYAKVKKALEEFDKGHAETLATEKEGLSADLERVRTEIDIRRQLALASKNRIDFLSEQLSRWNAVATSPEAGTPSSRSAEVSRLETRLREKGDERVQVEQALAVEKRQFTDKWHTVIELNQRLAGVDADIDATKAALAAAAAKANEVKPGTAEGTTGEAAGAPPAESDALAPLKALRKACEKEYEGARSDIAALKEQQDHLLERLARIPHTEAERRAFEKDFNQAELRLGEARKAFDHAAELAEFFRVSDASDVTAYAVQRWAVAPLTPTGPARLRIVLTAAGIGAIVGYGLTLLRRRFRRRVVVTPQDLLDLVPGSLVVSLPLLPSGSEAHWSPRFSTTGVLLSAWVIVCIGVGALAWIAHSDLVTLPSWLHGLLGIPA